MTDPVKGMNATQMLLDRLAILAAVLCALHCAVLPIALVSFPTLLSLPMDDHHFHQLLVWLIVPLSVLGVLFGCLRHKDKLVVLGAGIGIVIIIGAATFGHDLLGELGEKVATVVGSLVLIASHYRNFTLCKKENCSA